MVATIRVTADVPLENATKAIAVRIALKVAENAAPNAVKGIAIAILNAAEATVSAIATAIVGVNVEMIGIVRIARKAAENAVLPVSFPKTASPRLRNRR